MTTINFLEKKLNINGLIILVAVLAGAAMFVVPVDKLLLLFLGLIAFAVFVIKPQWAYYLIIFTIPFTERIRQLPISFSINDLLILLTFVCVIFNILLKAEKVDLRTKIDKWIMVLLVLYFFAGIHSLNDRGILSSFKFLEAILAYYMTVYFISTKKIKITTIIKILVAQVLFQTIFAVIQSLTGNFGVNLQTNRGYLGYLGIGPKTVWHGVGTFGHSASLADFLLLILFIYFPIFNSYLKHNLIAKISLFLILIGIYFTYSRMSILAIFVCLLFYYFINEKSKAKIIIKISQLLAFIIPAYMFFMHFSSFSSTERNTIWKYVWEAILSKSGVLIYGSGLNSYWELVSLFLPANIPPEQYPLWFAHNYYLLTIVQMGIIGLIIHLLFFIYLLNTAIRGFKEYFGLKKCLYLSLSLVIFSIIIISFTDHFFSLVPFQILSFILLGICFSLNRRNFLLK